MAGVADVFGTGDCVIDDCIVIVWMLGNDAPMLGDDTPVLGDDAPTLDDDTAALGDDTAALGDDTPALGGNAPAPTDNVTVGGVLVVEDCVAAGSADATVD